MKDRFHALFQQYDDHKHWENPPGFDRVGAEFRFRAFARELEERLGQTVQIETGNRIQDASFHSEILFPGGSLRFSSFGDMIAFTPDLDLSDSQLDAVITIAVNQGYTFVPTNELETPYDSGAATSSGIRTWWIRFFDYL